MTDSAADCYCEVCCTDRTLLPMWILLLSLFQSYTLSTLWGKTLHWMLVKKLSYDIFLNIAVKTHYIKKIWGWIQPNCTHIEWLIVLCELILWSLLYWPESSAIMFLLIFLSPILHIEYFVIKNPLQWHAGHEVKLGQLFLQHSNPQYIENDCEAQFSLNLHT